jgi:hypothetical protein
LNLLLGLGRRLLVPELLEFGPAKHATIFFALCADTIIIIFCALNKSVKTQKIILCAQGTKFNLPILCV